MRVWLYARLSNDDDVEQNSLENQLRITRDFALAQGHRVMGSSTDDNRSGMRFDRAGLEQLTKIVEAGEIDGVIVKDLSRLGRHRVQTALYIEYLLQKGVRVLSATESLDSGNEEDDLIIGIRGLMNDCYARDIGSKIRSGYRQKQREGIVIRVPFGYEKDRGTGTILPHPEAAETVRMIYAWYLSGLGQKEIARRLNALGRKTPMQIHNGRRGRDIQPSLWTYASVKNILRAEACAGVLVNHSSEHRNGKKLPVPADEQLRHESYFPALVSRAEWEEVQRRLDEQTGKNKKRCFLETTDGAAANKPNHRYAGLLHCAACGAPFVPMIRYWNVARRVEYVCKSYHRLGKAACSSHRIHEETLNAQAEACAESLRETMQTDLDRVNKLLKQSSLQAPNIRKRIAELKARAEQLEQEVDEILMEKLR